MNLGSTLVTTTAFLLYAVSFQAAAVTIDADRYPVGTDITYVVDGVTLNHYTHETYSDSIAYGPAITTSTYDQQRKALDLSAWNIRYLEYLEGAPLGELGEFSGLSITFDQAVRYLKVSAFSDWGDDLMVFLFDEYDNFLRYVDIGAKFIPGCDDFGRPCHRYSFHANLSDESVYRAAFGTDTDAIYLSRISFSVPEPSSLALLSLGLFVMGASALRHRRHAHDR